MSLLDTKSGDLDSYPLPDSDEEALALEVDWTPQEEANAKRK